MNRTSSENPLGLGLVIVGALAMAVAAFLPLDEPSGAFSTVQDNTLIQHGGWALIALALGTAASGYRLSQDPGGKTKWWVPTLLCAIAAAVIIGIANNKGLRTLYPIGPDGTPDTSQAGTVANLGIAIYVAGVGTAAAFIGSLILRQASQQRELPTPAAGAAVSLEADPTATKTCPDCAETILVGASVCKHCGYRFAAPGRLWAEAGQEHARNCQACGELNMVRSDDELCFACGRPVGH